MTTTQSPAPIDIYGRVSRKGDRNQRSVTGQVGYCRGVLADRGLPEGEVLTDDGRSAWNPRVSRPGWDNLMTRLEAGTSGGVIVFDLERFTRQPKEGERLIDAADRGLVVLDSDAEFDLTTASGKKAFRDAMAAAAYYSDRLSDRVKRGKKAKALAGEVDNGGKHRAFGFEEDNVTVRENEAEMIRVLAEHFLHGDTQDTLIRWFGTCGFTTARGGELSVPGLRYLLTRERNIGRLMHNGQHVADLPGVPILDAGTFARVVAKFAARRPGRPPSPAYLCSGAAECSRCQHRLSGRPRVNMKRYEDGEVHREYWCSPSSNGGCGRMAIDQRALDAHARELAVTVLSDPRHAAQVEAVAAAHEEEAVTLDSLIAADEGTALALADRLGRGEMDLARYDAATGPLDERLARLRAQRAALDVQDAPRTPRGSRAQWETRWEAATQEERRTLLRSALRGRVLVVGPVDPADRKDVSGRISVSDART